MATVTPLPTKPPKCPQSCCLAQANIDIKSDSKVKLEWTTQPGSELVEFLLSPNDNGNVVVEIDFSKTVEMSGFKVSSSVKSFQIYYKQDIVGSKFVPYRSDITGEVFTFLVNDGSNVFLPDGETVFARWIMIKKIQLISDSVQDVSFDILGCCGSCITQSTTAPTAATTSGASTPRTVSTSLSISTVTPECKHGDIVPKDNCTSYVCKDGKYVLVKVCNKVCEDTEQLVQLNEETCCECVPKSSTTVLPTTIPTTPTCTNATEAFLCHRKCGVASTEKCKDVYMKNPNIFRYGENYSSVNKCKCPTGYKLEDSLVTEDGIKYFCVQVNQCDCVIDGVTHEENSVWHPKDKFNKEMLCKECQCSEGLAECTNKSCTISCGEGSILVEPSEADEQCCYCANIPTTPYYTGSTESPYSTTPYFGTTTSTLVCDGCQTEVNGIHICKPKGSRWDVDNCETCHCEENGQISCIIIDCLPVQHPTCDPIKGEYLKYDTEKDKCCNTSSCHVCPFSNINITKCDGVCDCPTPDNGDKCPDEDVKNCPKPCQVSSCVILISCLLSHTLLSHHAFINISISTSYSMFISLQ